MTNIWRNEKSTTDKDRLLALVTESTGRHSVHGKAPVYTIGECVRSRYCAQFNVDLGNGYCVICWDKGLGGR